MTVNLGLRYEYYPLMSRADRGLEQLDYNTFMIKLGGLGGNPKDLGIKVDKALFAPRLGLAYRHQPRTQCFVPATGRRSTRCPGRVRCEGSIRRRSPTAMPASTASSHMAPWPPESLARPIRTSQSGNVPLPRGVAMRSPDPNDVKRGATQSWNVFLERRVPFDVIVSAGYVGTATDDGYADLNLNYAESAAATPTASSSRKAGNADILDWAARTRSRYHSLQMAVNRPFKDGLLLKGAYTFSKALNETDDDGWVGLTWNQPSQIHRNYARAGYDRPHMLQMGFVYELPFGRNSSNPVAYVVKNWQVSGIASWMSGRPFTIGGDNGLLQQVGRAADDQRDWRRQARLRRGRAERAVVRPVDLLAAG